MRGDGQGAVRRAVHSQEQRAHAALQQPRLKRPGHGTGIAPPRTDPLPERIWACGQHRAGQHVAVAVQVLGGGVNDQVGAEFQRPGEHRSRHRVVDGHPYPGGVGKVADGSQVGDLPHGVRRRLGPQQPGPARTDSRPHHVQIGGVGELHVQAPGEGELGQPLPRPKTRYSDASRRAQDQSGDLTTAVQESVLGIRAVGTHRDLLRASPEYAVLMTAVESPVCDGEEHSPR